MKIQYQPLIVNLSLVEIRQFNWPLIDLISFSPFPLGYGATEAGEDACVAVWKIKQLNTPTI